MKHFVCAAAGMLICASVFADDPPSAPPPAPQAPPTHVDTTVIGSAVADQPAGTAAPSLDNSHNFMAGAPDILRITNRLKLSPKQQAQLHAVIEQADAGAGVLIGREHDVKQMIAATTPADPAYAKLLADQSAGETRWTENRQNLRRDVLAILTPVQQRRYEELESQQPAP